MSKIAKAVERARKSRGASLGGFKSQSPVQVVRDSHEQPVYSQTRAVSLDSHCLEENRLFTLLDDGVAIDSYNVLCTQILSKTVAEGKNALMVTSCIDGEGKTTTSINLAVSISRRVQHNVLLVDVDLRSPKIHSYLGLNVAEGLSDYLKQDRAIPELLVNPEISGMVVLPAGKPLHGSTAILGSPKMELLVRELKSRYPDRYVIFDSPPLLSVPDALVFSSYVDGIVLVVEAGRTSKKQIREAVETLKDKPLLGLIMNKGEASPSGYYYHRQ